MLEGEDYCREKSAVLASVAVVQCLESRPTDGQKGQTEWAKTMLSCICYIFN